MAMAQGKKAMEEVATASTKGAAAEASVPAEDLLAEVVEKVMAAQVAAGSKRYHSPHSQFHADIRLTLTRHVHHRSTHRGPSPACRCKHCCTRSLAATPMVTWLLAMWARQVAIKLAVPLTLGRNTCRSQHSQCHADNRLWPR